MSGGNIAFEPDSSRPIERRTQFASRVAAGLPRVAMGVIAMMAALTGSSVAQDGVSGTTIVLGMEDHINSFSGDEENLGFRVAFQEANARGPIHGRTITWQAYSRADGAATDALIANFRKLIEQDRVLALINFAGGGVSDELLKISRDAKMPYLFPHSALVSSDGERYLFTSFPNYGGEAMLMYRYLAKERGAKRIGIVHDANVYGRFFVDRIKEHASAFGYQFVAAASVDTRNPKDLNEQLNQMIAADADTVAMALYPAQAKTLMTAKAQAKWKGRMVSSGPLTDEQFLKLPNGGAEGTLGFCYYPDPDVGQEPGIVSYRAAMARYHPGRPLNRYSLYGYTYGKLIVEGLQRAGRDLTREKLVDAMETIRDWDAGGVMPNVTLSKTNHHAQPSGFVCELRNDRFVDLSGWIKP